MSVNVGTPLPGALIDQRKPSSVLHIQGQRYLILTRRAQWKSENKLSRKKSLWT